MPDWTECQTKLWGIAVLIVVIGLHVFIIGDYKSLVYVKFPRSVLRLERMPTFYWTIICLQTSCLFANMLHVPESASARLFKSIARNKLILVFDDSNNINNHHRMAAALHVTGNN